MIHSARMGYLTIPSGKKPSQNLSDQAQTRFIDGFTIYPPATLTGACKLQVTFKDDPEEGDWVDLPDGTVAVTVPVTIRPIATAGLRVVSASNEGADRKFGVIGFTSVPG